MNIALLCALSAVPAMHKIASPLGSEEFSLETQTIKSCGVTCKTQAALPELKHLMEVGVQKRRCRHAGSEHFRLSH